MNPDVAGAIDLHHHFVPREYAAALHKLGISEGLGVKLPKWSARKSLDVMDANGIATAILSISAPGVYFPAMDPDGRTARQLAREMNEAAARLIREHPGRFGGFATLPVPDVDASLSEIDYAFNELRLDGVLLLSNYAGYYLRFKDNVLPEGPDHFLGTFHYDTALSASPHCFASLTTLVDSSHIVFGTDYVFATPAAVPLTVTGISDYPHFTAEDRRQIASGNARRLFPRLSESVPEPTS
ncbi:amidohydrolase family protein [Amycolatopsis alkalitolerans]|uniref:Amidohydrolase-related domain-containing protein n=1 Tax=Amycolatopsis alkalitolerans TaxID=2547244 RepID=A0A5C4MCN6_9PSEU|nr:amidohydrolase family protein [Amycolatopsis alkalitolerans]TNC29202.1 hypothetical protein FG385_03735 [Amycolatopsis alkalitolerans]